MHFYFSLKVIIKFCDEPRGIFTMPKPPFLLMMMMMISIYAIITTTNSCSLCRIYFYTVERNVRICIIISEAKYNLL